MWKRKWSLWIGLLLCGAASASAQSESAVVPLVPEGREERMDSVEPAWRWRQLSGDAALAEGFSALAASLYREALTAPGISPADGLSMRLSLLTALLASNQLAEAETVLPQVEPTSEGTEQQKQLRAAWLAYLKGNPEGAAEAHAALVEPALPPEDRPWSVLLNALLRHAEGDFETANERFATALAEAPTEGLRDHFELLRLRGELLAGKTSEEVVSELRMATRAMRGRVGEAEAARLLAVALARLGRTDEALTVIDEELQRPGIMDTARRFDFLLLLALISGDDSGRGRLSLAQILTGNAPAATQRVALSLLSRAPFQGRYRTEFLNFLGDLIAAPGSPAILDELLGLRALLRAADGDFNAAEIDATRLIEQFPGSSLFNEMHRLLAYVNWSRQPPRYRTAASHLNRLRGLVSDPAERAQLTVLMGDCYFLNGDYLNASDAYGSALRDPYIDQRGSILFQRILAEIRAGRLDEATRILDGSREQVALDAIRRWQAEWNLLDARRDAGQVEEAFRRLRALLDRRDAGSLPPELEVRMRWLEARLTLEAGRPSETPALVDALMNRVGAGDVLSAGDRAAVLSHALLLKGEALLTLGQRSEALSVFGELRTRFPDSGPDMLSYLIEARLAAGENSIVDSQSTLINLADRFPRSRYAPIALWEAALQVEQRGLDSSFREAIGILERLLQSYPNDSLAYYARLKQADLSRRLNDFGTALVLYERLLARYPDHPERFRAELSRADCLLARGSASTDSLAAASVVYERLLLDVEVPLDAQMEAGFKWGISLAQRNLSEGARQAFYTVKQRGLDDPERAVRLGAQGRYWMSRTLLELGASEESQKNLPGYANARKIYEQLIASGLPGQEVARNRLQRLGARSG